MVNYTGDGNNNNFTASTGADLLLGKAGNDTLTGDLGDDTIYGGSGNDSLLGGGGNDTIYGDLDTTEELVLNGSFASAANWTFNNPTGGPAPNVANGVAVFNGSGEAVYGDSVQQTINTIAGQSYAGSFRGIENSNGVGDHTVRVDVLDSSGAVIFTQTQVVLNSTNLPFTFNFIATTSPSTIRFTNTTSTNTVNTDLKIDNISVIGPVVSAGNDTIYGGEGNDQIYGDAGNDNLRAGLGNDTLFGGLGNDEIYGDQGDDTFTGGDGDDFMLGGTGNDTMAGDAGNDGLYGDVGQDSISGGDGNDLLSGENDNDTLDGGFGNDSLIGGDGDDYVTDESAGNAAGGGADTVSLGAGNDTFFGWGQNVGDTDLIYGEAGDDIITVRQAYDTVYGGDGNDVISSSVEDPLYGDIFFGDAGNDSITGANTPDQIYGGVGNDTMLGDSGNDTIVGDAGDDLVYAGSGNDNLNGGEGNDTVYAGAGDDSWQVGDTGEDLVYGGAGNDILSGDLGNDTLYGDDGNDAIEGHEGKDVIFGGAGNDYIIGADVTGITDPANRTINPTIGLDDGSNDQLYGGDGDDTVLGNAGNDQVAGGVGNDSLFGGDGADTLTGDSGNDSQSGGAGDDIFVLQSGFGLDTILGDETGETSGDTLDSTGIAGGINLTIGSTGENGTLVLGSDTATFAEIERYTLGAGNDTVNASAATVGINLDAGAGNDSILGGAGADTIFGGAGDDTVNSGGQTDLIYGGSGNDRLLGGDSIDMIYADTGNDTLNGGLGDDVTYGGDGNDMWLAGDEGNDLQYGGAGEDILSGDLGNDTLYGDADNDALEGHQGVDVLYGGAGDDYVTGADVIGISDLSSRTLDPELGFDDGSADSLFGGDGNDTVLGHAGNDQLSGGSGRDFLVGGTGNDQMEGGSGADVFILQGADTITDFDATTGVTDNGNLDNDFVDLTAFYNATTLAAWNAANPGNQYDNALKWLRGDQADGILQSAGSAQILNSGSAIAASLLNVENTAVCFAAGTRLSTAKGQRPIEKLRVGDLVQTADHGLQPIRWIGHMTVDGMGDLAPIRIAAGALGNRRDILVSPLHRMLVSGWQVDLLFGESEVIAAAKMLINGDSINAVPMAEVCYYHLMFDTHEIVFAEGAGAESFHPGEEGFDALGSVACAEILALFPSLAVHGFAAYGPSARRSLRTHEARLLKIGRKLQATGQIDIAPRSRAVAAN